MKPENELALIIGYYLSRLDKEGYILLGYKTFLEAVTDIGNILGVKKNTVKNMRDEFDPYHQNNRIGWKRKLSPSRERILKSFQNTDDETLTEIVKEILNYKDFKKTQEYKDIHLLFSGKRSSVVSIFEYTPRGITGRAAEEYFLKSFQRNSIPMTGILKDCRDFGCGYDFEIRAADAICYVEVKGLAGDVGGVSFTNKEWQMARKHRSRYYLVLVSKVSEIPDLRIIQDPYSKLEAHKNVYTTLQVSWSVLSSELKKTI